MKSVFIAVTLMTSAACSAAHAADLVVYATAKANGTMWTEGKSAFTKTFDVSIVNLSDKEANLSTLCLRAYGADKKSFGVDTVDDVLTRGILKQGKTVRGVVEFSSDSPAVYQAAMVKVFSDCP